MSFVDNEQDQSYVITYKEWIFTFIVFSAILFVLYPKDLLKEQILAETSNYDLSMLYLKNLLIHSPKDESLMLILAKQSLRSGKKDLSIRLLGLLLESKNRQTREQATLLKYDLEKEDYFYFKDREKQKEQRKKLKKLFLSIFNGKMYDAKDIDKWYGEALFVQSKRGIHYFLNKKIEKEPNNIELLEKDYYLEVQLHHKKHALKTLHALQNFDREHERKWLEAEYYVYVSNKKYVKARAFLLEHAQNSTFWTQKLADFYLSRRSYIKASDVYTQLFKEEKDYRRRRSYFYKSIKALQSGNLLSAAAQKVHKYENEYVQDINVRNFMLKIYMATGHLDYAENLSRKILKKEFR